MSEKIITTKDFSIELFDEYLIAIDYSKERKNDPLEFLIFYKSIPAMVQDSVSIRDNEYCLGIFFGHEKNIAIRGDEKEIKLLGKKILDAILKNKG